MGQSVVLRTRSAPTPNLVLLLRVFVILRVLPPSTSAFQQKDPTMSKIYAEFLVHFILGVHLDLDKRIEDPAVSDVIAFSSYSVRLGEGTKPKL